MKSSDSSPWMALASAGIDVAASVLGFTLLGLWLDRHCGWTPWATISGALIGILGGLYNLVRSELKAARAASAEDRERAGRDRDGGDRP